jgi:hypothetical protein
MSCEKDKVCWCADFPNILPLPESNSEGCLCRDCLTKQIELQADLPLAQARGSRSR